MALTFYEKHDFESASAQIDSVLAFENNPDKDKAIKDFLKKAKKLKKKIEKEAKTG
jgi:hypothetical protein